MSSPRSLSTESATSAASKISNAGVRYLPSLSTRLEGSNANAREIPKKIAENTAAASVESYPVMGVMAVEKLTTAVRGNA